MIGTTRTSKADLQISGSTPRHLAWGHELNFLRTIEIVVVHQNLVYYRR